MTGLRVSKIVKKISWKGSGVIRGKNMFPEVSFAEHLALNLVFMWDGALRGKFNL